MKVVTREFGFGRVFRARFVDDGYLIGDHLHQHPEIIFVKEGTMKVVIDGEQFTLSAGEICIISPFRIHFLRSNLGCRFWFGVFSSSCIPEGDIDRELLSKRKSPIFKPSEQLLDYLMKNLISEDKNSLVLIDNIPRRIRSALLAVFSEYIETVPPCEQLRNSHALSSLILYVTEHFKENITLAAASKELGYNAKYLSQCLSELPNVNFNHLLNSCRVELAKNMLVGTEYKMIDIAYECGFAEERTFRRAFAKIVGMSPSEYKKIKKASKKNYRERIKEIKNGNETSNQDII